MCMRVGEVANVTRPSMNNPKWIVDVVTGYTVSSITIENLTTGRRYTIDMLPEVYDKCENCGRRIVNGLCDCDREV